MAVWRQLHQAMRKFRSPKPISQLRNEIHLQNFARYFADAKPTFGTRVPFRSPCLHLRTCEPCCKITSKLRMKLKLHPQAVKQVANHLQVAESPPSCEITNSTCKIKVQTCKMDNSTCEIHLCNPRYLWLTLLDLFFIYFCINPYFLFVIHQS